MPLVEIVMADRGEKFWLQFCFLAILFAQIPQGESSRLQKSSHRNPLVVLLNNDDGYLQSLESLHSNEGRESQWYHNKRDTKRYSHSYEQYHDNDRHNRLVQNRHDHGGKSSVYDKLLPYVNQKTFLQLKKLLGDDSRNGDDRHNDDYYLSNREFQQRRKDRQRRGDNGVYQQLKNKYDNNDQNNYRQYDRKDLDRKDRQRYRYNNGKNYGNRNNRVKHRHGQGKYQTGNYNYDLQRNYYKGNSQRHEYRGNSERHDYRGYAKKDVYRKPRPVRDYNHLRARLDDLENREEQDKHVQLKDQDQDNKYKVRLQALRTKFYKHLDNLEKSPVKYLLRAADNLDCAAKLECIKKCLYNKPPKKNECEDTCEEEITCKDDDDEDEDLCNESGHDSCGGDSGTGSTKGVPISTEIENDCC